MSTFRAVVLLPQGHPEARYEFEAPESYLARPPSQIFERFLETILQPDLPKRVRLFEVNAAQRSGAGEALSGLGTLWFEDGTGLPFVAMISPAAA